MDTMTERHNTSRTTKSATKTPRATIATPPLTKGEAISTNTFHENHATNADGTCRRWHRNGSTKTWKRSPSSFRIPVKHGMYRYGAITEGNAGEIHTEENCPYRSQ